MIQGGHKPPHASPEGKPREGFLEKGSQFNAWKGERRGGQGSQLGVLRIAHLWSSYPHLGGAQRAAQNLLKAKGVELGLRQGAGWSSGPHPPLRAELHMGVKFTLVLHTCTEVSMDLREEKL